MSPEEYSIDPAIRSQIIKKLHQIESDFDVLILFAIESGSRAWGFPSPDSDYDVRFVYLHKRNWYLALDKRRDVIELPIEADLDINGWDLKKALQLLIKSNPVLIEWLASPIQYVWNEAPVELIKTLAKKVERIKPSLFHYINTGEEHFRRAILDAGKIKLKRYFYSLRPALALRWMRIHKSPNPPMDMHSLMRQTNLSDQVSDSISQLIEKKKTVRELGNENLMPDLNGFILAEFETAKENAAQSEDAQATDMFSQANETFLKILELQEITQ